MQLATFADPTPLHPAHRKSELSLQRLRSLGRILAHRCYSRRARSHCLNTRAQRQPGCLAPEFIDG